jgi:hypothetical protein
MLQSHQCEVSKFRIFKFIVSSKLIAAVSRCWNLALTLRRKTNGSVLKEHVMVVDCFRQYFVFL